MRRDEFLTTDPELLAELAARCPEGYLALSPLAADDFPRAVAVNFALAGDRIYFHGALAGDKFERLAARPRVGFTIAHALSTIPSHWIAPDGSACPATQLYLSVEIGGRCAEVADPAERAAGLQVLMEKYQPEGGFRPLTAADPGYDGSLRRTGVFRLAIERWTGKVRLAREKPEAFRRELVQRLLQRGASVDLETADRIVRTLDKGNSAAP